ncbi:MAG: tRNA (guanosine(46)-N7)-methyltransferase TrmB [Myxococcota bacterium]
MTAPPKKSYREIAPMPPEGAIVLPSLFEPSVGAGPLEIDVGFGRGMSVFERAARAPDSRIVGIEIKRKWATRVEARRQRRGLAHVRIFAAEVLDFFRRSEPEGAVSKIFVQFPDPWWKKRHQKRRVVSDAFLDAAAELLSDGGALFVQTDVEERFVDYRDLIATHAAFAPPESVDANPFGAISNRERRAIDDGLPVYRLVAHRRRRGEGAHRRPEQRDQEEDRSQRGEHDQR